VNDTDRLRYLRIALVVTGVIAIACVYPLMLAWPSGWAWESGYAAGNSAGHSDYALMIVGIYATLGVFLILAARDPLAHRSLIGFAVWSSVVHGGIMAVQSLTEAGHRGHLLGDVPALFTIAIVLAVLTPRRGKGASPRREP
jgi:hypothetical protein